MSPLLNTRGSGAYVSFCPGMHGPFFKPDVVKNGKYREYFTPD